MNPEATLDAVFPQSNEFTIEFSEWQRCEQTSAQVHA